MEVYHLPSGKRLHNYGKSSCSMGKSTISMAIFNSKLLVITRQLRYRFSSHWPHPDGVLARFIISETWKLTAVPPAVKIHRKLLRTFIYNYIYYVYIYIYILYRDIHDDSWWFMMIHDDSWWFMMYMLLHSSAWQFHHELHDVWIDCWNYVTKIRKHNESQWLFLWHQHTSRLS